MHVLVVLTALTASTMANMAPLAAFFDAMSSRHEETQISIYERHAAASPNGAQFSLVQASFSDAIILLHLSRLYLESGMQSEAIKSAKRALEVAESSEMRSKVFRHCL